jgi:hypothetical protein
LCCRFKSRFLCSLIRNPFCLCIGSRFFSLSLLRCGFFSELYLRCGFLSGRFIGGSFIGGRFSSCSLIRGGLIRGSLIQSRVLRRFRRERLGDSRCALLSLC